MRCKKISILIDVDYILMPLILLANDQGMTEKVKKS